MLIKDLKEAIADLPDDRRVVVFFPEGEAYEAGVAGSEGFIDSGDCGKCEFQCKNSGSKDTRCDDWLYLDREDCESEDPEIVFVIVT